MNAYEKLIHLKNRGYLKPRIAPDYYKVISKDQSLDYLSSQSKSIVNTIDGEIYIFDDGSSIEIEGEYLSMNNKAETDHLLMAIDHED
jgi:hypothetical protein